MPETKLTNLMIFESARELLEAGVSCREIGGKGWAFYWMEGGAELTLFPGGEGPQEMADVDEAIEAIGGDQSCVLTPASIKRFGTLEKLQVHLRQVQPKLTQMEFTDFIHVTCCQEQPAELKGVVCDVCGTWAATQFINSYAVCDKPRCQDRAEEGSNHAPRSGS